MTIPARRKILLPIGLVGLVWWGISVSAGPKDLKLSNLTAGSLTLTWTTPRPTRGCVIGYGCDDHRQKLTTHNVTLSGLEPNTEYRFLVRNGWNFKSVSGETAELIETMPQLPNPAYGQVILADGIELARYVNVFVDVNGKTKSAFTNDNGGFTIDLADAGDQKAFFLSVDGGAAGLARKLFFLGEHQPIGIIKLEPRQDINPLTTGVKSGSAKDLFHRLNRTYWDAAVYNIADQKYDIAGVALVKYDFDLDRTFIFSAVRNLPLLPERFLRLWLVKNITDYLPAGMAEFAAEGKTPVAYTVFVGDGNLTDYDQLLFSLDSGADAAAPDSVILTINLVNP